MLDAPYEYKCWIDVDCEVLLPIKEIFLFPTDDKIALTQDVTRDDDFHVTTYPGEKKWWWATGVNVAKGKPRILQDWASHTLQGDMRGDQEILKIMIQLNPTYHGMIVEMPLEYQWLRLSLERGFDNSNKKIIHWTGREGKNI